MDQTERRMDFVSHAEGISLKSSGHKPRFPRRVCTFYKTRGHCSRGDSCSFAHSNPKNTSIHNGEEGLDPFFVEFIAEIGDCPVEPPNDQSIKMLYVRRLKWTGILEQDLRDRFSVYGEIEAVRMVAERRGCAFISFTTRHAAEKAMDDLKTWVEIKGHRLKVLWAYTYKPELFTTLSNQEVDQENQHPPLWSWTRIEASSTSSCEMSPDKRRKIE